MHKTDLVNSHLKLMIIKKVALCQQYVFHKLFHFLDLKIKHKKIIQEIHNLALLMIGKIIGFQPNKSMKLKP